MTELECAKCGKGLDEHYLGVPGNCPKPRKPTRMVRVGWMIYDEVFWGRKPDPRAIPIYAKRTDVKGSGK